jgi:hypothetical protein
VGHEKNGFLFEPMNSQDAARWDEEGVFIP